MPNESAAATDTKKPEIFLHTVEVEISTEESAARTKRLLEVLNEIDKIEADKASRNSDFNAELKQKRKEAHKVRDAINLGKERRDVECYEKPDERRNIVFIVRAADDKVLDERAMTLEDRMHVGQSKAEAKKADEAANGPVEPAAGAGGGGEAAAPKTGKSSGATVTRIKASDVKKRKAAKEAADQARQLADENDRKNAAAAAAGGDDDSDEDDDE